MARERRATEERLRRLGQVYLDELLDYDDYRRQKRQLEEKLGSLIVPGIEAAQAAGNLLENLPALWEAADLGERRKILMTMLAAVYVETVEERAVVALQPKPAFQALFQLATTREGSGVVLLPGVFGPQVEPQQDGHSQDPQPSHVGRQDHRVLPVESVGQPQAGSSAELEEGQRTHVSHRPGSPHLHHLGHEPQRGQQRRQAPHQGPPQGVGQASSDENSPQAAHLEAEISPAVASDDSLPCFWWRRGRLHLHRNTATNGWWSARELVLVEMRAG